MPDGPKRLCLLIRKGLRSGREGGEGKKYWSEKTSRETETRAAPQGRKEGRKRRRFFCRPQLRDGGSGGGNWFSLADNFTPSVNRRLFAQLREAPHVFATGRARRARAPLSLAHCADVITPSASMAVRLHYKFKVCPRSRSFPSFLPLPPSSASPLSSIEATLGQKAQARIRWVARRQPQKLDGKSRLRIG